MTNDLAELLALPETLPLMGSVLHGSDVQSIVQLWHL